MSHRAILLPRIAALAASIAAVVVLGPGGGCSSSDGGSGPAPPAKGPSASAALVAPSVRSRTDENCTSANAKSGATCAVDCTIPCGFQRLGTKVCSCVGGVYVTCPCPAPPGWQGAATAPPCDVVVPASASGLASALKNAPCDTEWAECVGREPFSGNTPQGCACLTNPATGKLQWYCGSTNKWFTPSM